MRGNQGSRFRRKRSARRDGAPSQWIYQNLTPWRIHACYQNDGSLVPRTREGVGTRGEDCEACVANVLSIPALGEIAVPNEDARWLNTLSMRRLGQIEVRPGPSELLTNLPRAIVIFGWLLVGLFFGAWALFFGGGSAVPWAWFVATVVIVPVVALIVATAREIHVYHRFSRYRRTHGRPDGLHQSSTGTAGSDVPSPRSLEGVDRGSRIRTFVDGMPRQAAEAAVLIGAVTVSVIGLGIAIHLTTQLNDLLPIDYGAIFRLENPFTDVTELARSSPAFWQLLVGHIAQWTLVSVAVLAPAAMYFQFDRQRLASVQRRWVQEVFRLDSTVRTVRDIEAKYGSQIESSFGILGPDSGLRLRSGRRSPVIVATLLLVVGWFLVVSATEVPDLVEVSRGGEAPADPATPDTELVWSAPPLVDDDAAGDNAGSGAVPVAADGADDDGSVADVADEAFPVSAFFRPQLSLIGYAFLGAYIFTLFHVLRGYQRRDLHPKTYNTVVVRILSAYVLALVVSVVYTGPAAEVLMFFVGFVPQSALVWLREKLAQDSGVWRRLPLHEPAPLTELEGIDLYDRTRLAEEGINNVEGLAHADIVELMSSTRISAAELVDWADQAILYLRVGGDCSSHDEDGRRTESFVARLLRREPDDHPTTAEPTGSVTMSTNGDQPARTTHDAARGSGAPAEPATPLSRPDVRRNLGHLRTFGIRTATDLLQAYEQALRRGRDRESRAREVRLLRDALELPGAPRSTQVLTIQIIIDTLPDEEWFVQLRNWRNPEFNAVDAWYWYLDGRDWTLTRTHELPPRVEHAKSSFASVPLIAVSDPGGVDRAHDQLAEVLARGERSPVAAADIVAGLPTSTPRR